ncbi:MAG TPA: DUF1223 domain-containing protein [Vicinamibacterales bacterium]|nr:DUF1223 domain-containing protein [Vicinamibacterales bacterium]
MKRFGWLVVVFAGGMATVGAGPRAAGGQASATVPVIVELFTSEGCSSCPPADRLLIELVEQQPIKGALVIGIGEHVDYWDQLGWKDPFSDRAFTTRQSVYAHATGAADVYTPQIIVDGVDVLVGHDRAGVHDAIRRAAGRRKADVRLDWAPRRSELSVGVERSSETANATVFLAITEGGLRTSVKRGENAGRMLDHAAVARKLFQLGKTDREGRFSSVVPLSLEPAWSRQTLRIVVFVQTDNSRRVVAAAILGA